MRMVQESPATDNEGLKIKTECGRGTRAPRRSAIPTSSSAT
jgi:hypothetical protein